MTIISLIITIIIIIAWFTLLLNNPINLTIIILIIAALTSLTYRLTISSWFRLILLLIYIGGIIIIFSYFISLNSNDPIFIKSKLYLILIPIIIIKRYNLHICLPVFYRSQVHVIYLTKNIPILLFIRIILLLIIIIVIKIVKTNNGPLRGLNK